MLWIHIYEFWFSSTLNIIMENVGFNPYLDPFFFTTLSNYIQAKVSLVFSYNQSDIIYKKVFIIQE